MLTFSLIISLAGTIVASAGLKKTDNAEVRQYLRLARRVAVVTTIVAFTGLMVEAIR